MSFAAAPRTPPALALDRSMVRAGRGSNRYIGAYHPKPIKVDVLRYDQHRKMIADTVDRDRLIAAIAKHLHRRMNSTTGMTIKKAYA